MSSKETLKDNLILKRECYILMEVVAVIMVGAVFPSFPRKPQRTPVELLQL